MHATTVAVDLAKSVLNAPDVNAEMSIYFNVWPYGGSSTPDPTFALTSLTIPGFVDS